MVEVSITCPSCKRIGNIDVKENIILKSHSGITAIKVAQFFNCNHSFIAYIDQNFKCRDCFIIDFTIELPELVLDENKEEILIPKADKIDLFLILINFGAQKLAYTIRAIFLGKKIVLINDLETLNNHIENLLIFGIQDTFKYKVVIISHENYKKNKKQYKNHLIIENDIVLNDKDKLLKNNRMKIENSIIEKFLREKDRESALIIFKNEFWKARELLNEIMSILKNYECKNKMSKKELIKKLRERYSIKLSFLYLEFLLEILEKHDKFNLKVLSGHYNPRLGF